MRCYRRVDPQCLLIVPECEICDPGVRICARDVAMVGSGRSNFSFKSALARTGS